MFISERLAALVWWTVEHLVLNMEKTVNNYHQVSFGQVRQVTSEASSAGSPALTTTTSSGD